MNNSKNGGSSKRCLLNGIHTESDEKVIEKVSVGLFPQLEERKWKYRKKIVEDGTNKRQQRIQGQWLAVVDANSVTNYGNLQNQGTSATIYKLKLTNNYKNCRCKRIDIKFVREIELKGRKVWRKIKENVFKEETDWF